MRTAQLAAQQPKPNLDCLVGLVGAGALSRIQREPPAECLIPGHADDRRSRRLGIINGDDQPRGVVTCADQLAWARRGIGHDRGKTARHGLEQGVRRALEARGHDEELGAAQEGERIGDLAVPADARLRCRGRERGP